MKIRYALATAIIMTAIVAIWWLVRLASNSDTKTVQNQLAPTPVLAPIKVLATKSPEVAAPTTPPAPVSAATVDINPQKDGPTGPPVPDTPAVADLKRQAAMQKQKIDAMQSEREAMVLKYGETQLDPASNFMADQLQQANQEVVARKADLDKFVGQTDSPSHSTAEAAYEAAQNKLTETQNNVRSFTRVLIQFDELNKQLQAAEPIYDNLLSTIQQQENAIPSGQ